MKTYKCEAMGDTVYILAENLDGAKARLLEVMGEIPSNLLKWSESEGLPDGEEYL